MDRDREGSWVGREVNCERIDQKEGERSVGGVNR